MSLPRQLLLLAGVLLLLPLGGWQAAVQVEGFLRQAREEALLATAEGLARAWEDDGSERLAAAAAGLPIHRVNFPIVTDGYPDDWSAWLPYATQLESEGQRLRAEVLLCRDGRLLYGLIRVTDDTGPRAAVSPSGPSRGDHVVLALEGPRGLRRIRLVPSVPGTLDVMDGGSGEPSPPVSGAWREDPAGTGYVVEFSLPAALVRERMGWMVVDANEPWPGAGPAHVGTVDSGGDLVMRTLAEPPAGWDERLEGLTPRSTRTWLLDASGRVMAHAGALPLGATATGRWWYAGVYKLLAPQALGPARARDPAVDLALDGSEVHSAVSGRPSVRWQAGEGEFSVQMSAAVPVRHAGQVAGALVVEQRSDGLLLAANRTVARTVLGSLALVVLVVAALMTFAGIHSLRIRRLRDAVDAALDQAGQSPIQLPAYSARDEIGDLSRSFEALLSELNQYNDYLRSLAGKLSHELNTPLAVVRSSLDNLGHEDLGGEARRYAERAREGAERLQGILRSMSEAHRLEEALEEQDAEDFDLGEVVRGCFEAYRSLAPDFDWQLDLAEGECPLHGSPELIAQLLDKLVDNARSFTPSGGLIRIALERHQRGPVLRVANDGPVLPDHLRGRLFQSLVSLREPGEGMHLGLGLHVVRLVAQLHRGAVAARNRPGDAGVEFLVRLRGMPGTRPGES